MCDLASAPVDSGLAHMATVGGGGQRGLNGEQQGLDTDICHHSAPERRDAPRRQVKMHKDLTKVQRNLLFLKSFMAVFALEISQNDFRFRKTKLCVFLEKKAAFQ